MRAEPSGDQQRGDWAFACVSVLSALPLWLTAHPPIQDWPQHLAAIRVLHSYADPSFGFEQYFVLEPLRTQYLSVYYISAALAFVVGIPAAAKLVLTAGIVGLPLAVRSLARALGRPGSVGLMALPLAYSAHTILGFVNFVVALPLMLWAVALSVRATASRSRSEPWLAAAALLICFYTHVVPFALGAFGVLLVSLRGPWKSLGSRLLPLGAIGAWVLPWFFLAPAGRVVVALALGRPERGVAPTYDDFDTAVEQLPRWLIEVWRGDWDYWLLRLWLVLFAVWALSGFARAWSRRRDPGNARAQSTRSVAPISSDDGAEVGTGWAVLALSPLPLLAAGAYFLAPSSYDWIWPINARFALLAVVLTLPLLPRPEDSWLRGLSAVSALLALVGVACVANAFLVFEREEVRGLDDAIEHIPPRQRVAGLIFHAGSRVVGFAPFLHSVAYYQAARGGAVMFTFADFPQSVFRFRDGARPPRVAPRWEWLPHHVDVDRDLDWYDWVLTRGGPGLIRHSREFELSYSSSPWAVWRRRAEVERVQPPM